MLKSVLIHYSAWDYSGWVRSYALYLEERLECFRTLKYDMETYHTVRKNVVSVLFC